MFMFGYGYVNMNIFVTTLVTKVILEPIRKVEPYLRRKFLEEQLRICQSLFFDISGENQKSSLGQRRKSIPDLIWFWTWPKEGGEQESEDSEEDVPLALRKIARV